MALENFAVSHVGLVRELNEDAFAVNEDIGLFLVADGMGGQAAGEVASQTAAGTISEFIQHTANEKEITWPLAYDVTKSRAHNRLMTGFKLANKQIFAESAADSDKSGMGTTAVCALIENNRAIIANVGDSRAYLLRGNNLSQITRDHSWIMDQVDQGILTLEQAAIHPFRNIITRALGVAEDVDVDLFDHELKNGDLLLLCSDGLTSMVNDQEIADTIKLRQSSLETYGNTLLELANLNGGTDNITIVMTRYYA